MSTIHSTQRLASTATAQAVAREASRVDWLAGAAAVVVGLQAIRSALETDLDLVPRAALVAAIAAIVGLSAAALVVGGRIAAGTGAVAAGSIGIVTGAYGVAELLFAGPSVGALLGTTALLLGLGLLGVGGFGLIRATPGWWRLGAIPVGFLVFQFWLLPGAMALFGTHPAHAAFTAAAPEAAVPVSLLTRDGITLEAWYTPSQNRGAVVLLHGAGGSKADTREHAAVLAEAGYGVLALDTRGAGESGGRGMLWGWHGDLDIGAAVAWLAERPEVDPGRIGAVGLSMGGEQAITAAATNPVIRTVVAEGASARTPADVAPLLTDDLSGAIQRLYYPIMWGIADLFTAAQPPIPLTEAVRRFDGRELLLISSDDPNDKAAGPVLHDADPATVTLWEPSNGHTLALATHPVEWRGRVLDFLDRTLAP